MSFLDNVIGSISGASAPGATGGALLQHVTEMLSSSQPGGGLGGLVQSFEQAGLGHLIASWVGTGQNLPISPEQLAQVLGSGRLGSIAQSLGIPPDQLSAQLSQLLPELINHLTPAGQVPAGGIAHQDVAGALTAVLGKFATAARA
ncbi:MAG TPA: YidB family protein [Steroidobacteraceae bacterium]|nr:YidB family protein [Steroidobacteraceae bacterium]